MVKRKQILEELSTALLDFRSLWADSNRFADPVKISPLRAKWEKLYSSAKNRTGSVFYRHGFFGKDFTQANEEFLQEYETAIDRARLHNQEVAARRAPEVARTILPVEGRTLDLSQLRCIATEVHNQLILAGAGTGKTTTIVGFVKYLLLTGWCAPGEILVLSFTNASATEMAQRIDEETGYKLDAMTFHKLGMRIIAAAEGKKPSVYGIDLRLFVRGELDKLVTREDYLRNLCLVYPTFTGGACSDDLDFENEKEYRKYLEAHPPVTMKKEKVKSYGEVTIANFLYWNDIAYEYETPYPVDTRTAEYAQYKPDFFLPEYGIYIEYFGINSAGEAPSYFTGRDGMSGPDSYREGMRWKRALHQEYHTVMIEAYAYENREGTLEQNLDAHLKEQGVVFRPKPASEIWSEIAKNNRESGNQALERTAEFFSTVITLMKSNEYTIADVKERNHRSRAFASIDRTLDLIFPIYDRYQEELAKRGEIDFNDMINRAAGYVLSGKYRHNYKVVIVDEYQDISRARYRLLRSMREQKDYRLFCVGDDWQSIYRFSGSDIGFILNFEKYWGPSQIGRIETTYRFPQALIDISSGFIMRNPYQLRKTLNSVIPSKGFPMERITGYTETLAVEFLCESLRDLPNGSTVLFLGRNRFDVKILEGCESLSYRIERAGNSVKVEFKDRSDLQITFMTVHSSKGLQADYVFLLNNKKNGAGFPNQISDPPILALLLENTDNFRFAEERRLFYVAITRAKKKVWLVTVKGNESEFIDEIKAVYGEAMRRERFTCPVCGGRLIRRTSKYGDFFGCSNYFARGCRYTRNIGKRPQTNQKST